MSAPPPSIDDHPEPTKTDWGWTPAQRTGLAILLSLLLAFLIIRYIRRPFQLNDSLVILHNQPTTLPTRIDPNTASFEELSRIPHLGENLVNKIIDYREARKPLTPDNIVFHQPEDLEHIQGIGKSTADQLRPYLQFPDDPDDPDTQPAP